MFETSEWSVDKSIFAFYVLTHRYPKEEENYEDVLGYLYVPVAPNTYKRIFIDTFENEGGPADINAIFFANADKDTARELVVMIKWFAKHYQIEGYLYETRIYDNIPKGTYPDKLVFLKKTSAKVSGAFDGYREGEDVISKFKTAKEVRAGLKKLGY